jgi:peptidoglycan/LPS O-acetylase OafA/YrhL
MNRNLDLLRALAVSFVVVSHVPHYVDWPQVPYSFDTLGRLGVAMFFVHTTLVLLQSLERSPEAVPFFIRRAFRIYPLSVAVVLITTALYALGGQSLTWEGVASNLLLIQNITGHVATPTPLWTLPYEIQMYLLLPALYAVTKTPRAVQKTALLWLASVAVAVSGVAPLLVFAPCFLGGMLAFTMRGMRPTVSPAVLFALVACLAAVIPFLVDQGAQETPLFWCASLLLGIVIPRCREVRPGATARCAGLVATYSYGIYLTHVYAMSLAFSSRSPDLYSWVVFAVLLPGLSVLAYRWIERPGIELGKRLADQMKAKKSDDLEPAGAVPLTSPVESK